MQRVVFYCEELLWGFYAHVGCWSGCRATSILFDCVLVGSSRVVTLNPYFCSWLGCVYKSDNGQHVFSRTNMISILLHPYR